MNRLFLMREMYQAFVEVGRDISRTSYEDLNNDPFYVPPEDQLIGTENIFLEPLSYLISIRDPFPIIDCKARAARRDAWGGASALFAPALRRARRRAR